jgi:hypothetical protein
MLLVIGFTAVSLSINVIHFDVKKVSGHFSSMEVCKEPTTFHIILLYNYHFHYFHFIMKCNELLLEALSFGRNNEGQFFIVFGNCGSIWKTFVCTLPHWEKKSYNITTVTFKQDS